MNRISIASPPAWRCGLKPADDMAKLRVIYVTSCVEVWVETYHNNILLIGILVTSCVEVWVETFPTKLSLTTDDRHLLRGGVG